MRIFLISLFVFVSCENRPEMLANLWDNSEPLPEIKQRDYSTFHEEALDFCQQNGYNTEYYFLVDLSVHPGLNRFFIYDFEGKEITQQNLVTHGACDVNSANPDKWETAKFSNVPESHCSSKGKYELGERDISNWGIGVKYWIKGLEATNNNAAKRVVVLHSWNAVPDEQPYPDVLPLSWGCPAVSNSFMRELDEKIEKTENKKILFWIID